MDLIKVAAHSFILSQRRTTYCIMICPCGFSALQHACKVIQVNVTYLYGTLCH